MNLPPSHCTVLCMTYHLLDFLQLLPTYLSACHCFHLLTKVGLLCGSFTHRHWIPRVGVPLFMSECTRSEALNGIQVMELMYTKMGLMHVLSYGKVSNQF